MRMLRAPIMLAMMMLALAAAAAETPAATASPIDAASPMAPRAPTPVSGVAAGPLVFADEFDGAALDTDAWATCYSYAAPGTNCTNAGNTGNFLEAQCHTPRNVSVGAGVLRLTARLERSSCQGLTKAFTSGMVQARNSPADRLYGYFEARIRIGAPNSASVGFWPAFWLTPHQDGRWPPEIDVFEFFGGNSTGPTGAAAAGPGGLHPQRFTSTVHITRTRAPSVDYYGPGGPGSTLWDQDYHVWGLDWRPGRLDVYVDRHLVWHLTGAGVPAVRMYPLLDLVVRAKYAADAAREVPYAMTVDYVRVWK